MKTGEARVFLLICGLRRYTGKQIKHGNKAKQCGRTRPIKAYRRLPEIDGRRCQKYAEMLPVPTENKQ